MFVLEVCYTGMDFGGGGVQGVATPPPPNGQSHSINYSAADVLSHADALIYLAKSLVVVVVSSIQVFVHKSWCSLRFCTCWSAC